MKVKHNRLLTKCCFCSTPAPQQSGCHQGWTHRTPGKSHSTSYRLVWATCCAGQWEAPTRSEGRVPNKLVTLLPPCSLTPATALLAASSDPSHQLPSCPPWNLHVPVQKLPPRPFGGDGNVLQLFDHVYATIQHFPISSKRAPSLGKSRPVSWASMKLSALFFLKIAPSEASLI